MSYFTDYTTIKMNKLTKQQIEEIKKIYSEGIKDMYQIAKDFKVSQPCVHYWIKSRDKVLERVKKRVKNLTKEQKKLIYQKKKEYLKNYLRERYQNDPVFREKIKERNRKK